MQKDNHLNFKEFHLLSFLEGYGQSSLPMDKQMSEYFRKHRALGSKDKKYISENGYALLRWKGLVDYHLKGKPTWQKRWDFFSSHKIEDLLKNELPIEARCSAPQFLVEKLQSQLSEEELLEYCHISNERAPLTIRCNSALITRDELIELLIAEGHEVEKTKHSPWGITFLNPTQVFSIDCFKKGYFEVQDEASQLAANLLDISPGMRILDFCSGAGGKALAFAHKTEGKGQIFLHDIRKNALYEARKRLKRAQVQNYQLLFPESLESKKWKHSFDAIFVDAPCSGSGTLRRNPDLKWKLDDIFLSKCQGSQKHIFEKALRFLKPSGKIIYCTCSVLREENEEQVDFFLKHHPVTLDKPPFSSKVSSGGMDGFFAAQFTRKDH